MLAGDEGQASVVFARSSRRILVSGDAVPREHPEALDSVCYEFEGHIGMHFMQLLRQEHAAKVQCANLAPLNSDCFRITDKS